MAKHHNYLVNVEIDDNGVVTPLSLEALNVAKLAAGIQGASVSVLVLGPNVAPAVEELQFHQIDKIFKREADELGHYRPRRYLSVFEKVYHMLKPELTVFGNSKNSLDFAARAAIQLDAALVTDCIKIKSDNEGIAFTKPVYSNNVLAVYAAGDSPCIVTIRPKSTSPSEPIGEQQGEIIDLGPLSEPISDEYEIIETCNSKDGEKKLSDAGIIVAGGRGIGGPEGFAELEKLAGLLEGQVGSTRPPCDLGWVSPGAQVGITGEIVSPDVYIAVGVSGSFQHMAGMSGAKTVVAINTDPNANIFNISDYGVVGEYEEVLAGLIKEIRK
jgi:electron transfer flavoprotein alpha subunit